MAELLPLSFKKKTILIITIWYYKSCIINTTRLIRMSHFQPPQLRFKRWEQPGYIGYSSWPHQNNPVWCISYPLFTFYHVPIFSNHLTTILIRMCHSSHRRNASTSGLDPVTLFIHLCTLPLTYIAMEIINRCCSNHYFWSSRQHIAGHLDFMR
jgi:hypothetical protein